MTLLNKDAILSAKDLKTEKVTIRGWGGEIIVSELDGEALVEFYELVLPAESEDAAAKKISDSHFQASLLAFAIVDDAGQRVFGNEDIPALSRKSRAALKQAFDVADKLSLVTIAARKAAEKNSSGEETGEEASSSSPENSASPLSGTCTES